MIVDTKKFPPGVSPTLAGLGAWGGLGGGLGACDPLDSACVEREFEASVAAQAAQQTAQNRLLRAQCYQLAAQGFRSQASCDQQSPDVTSAGLWAGTGVDTFGNPLGAGAGGAVQFGPTTGMITSATPSGAGIPAAPVYVAPGGTGGTGGTGHQGGGSGQAGGQSQAGGAGGAGGQGQSAGPVPPPAVLKEPPQGSQGGQGSQPAGQPASQPARQPGPGSGTDKGGILGSGLELSGTGSLLLLAGAGLLVFMMMRK